MKKSRSIWLVLLLLTTACPQENKSSPMPELDREKVIKPLTPVEPQDLPHKEVEKKKTNTTKYSVEAWSGRGDQYCTLRLLNPISGFYEKVESLVKEGRHQEAIWLLEERGPNEKAYAKKLKEKLIRLYTEGHYEVIPKNLGGTTKKLLLKFDGGILGLFKSSEESKTGAMPWADDKAEVSAYQLDQLLHLDFVPLTVPRSINSEEGSIQYFFTVAEPAHLEHTSARNFPALKVFDYLIGNLDRKYENLLYWSEQDRVIGIDNGFGFKDNQCGELSEIKKYLELVPVLQLRIDSIQDEEIEHALSRYLQHDAIHRLLQKIHALKSSAHHSF